MNSDLIRTAFNEAGHVVHLWQHDHAVWSATTIAAPQDSDVPYLGCTDPVEDDPWQTTAGFIDNLIAGLAGEIIGGEIHGYHVDHMLNGDTQRAACILWTEDGEPGPQSTVQAEAYLRKALMNVDHLLAQVRQDSRFQIVADELLKSRELDFATLEAIRALPNHGST